MAHPPIVSVKDKVAFLSQTAAYPEPAGSVEVIETHMAWVFLAGQHAYKLKKPVILPFLDFGTVEARRHVCREEVRLNRRLAPRIYLGTVALTLEPDGRLQLGGVGLVVDWLVRMVRLPGDRALDRLLASGEATEQDMVAVAIVLTRFYRQQPPIHRDPTAHCRFFLDEISRIAEALIPLGDAHWTGRVQHVLDALHGFLTHCPGLLEHRVLDGRLVEGHGDLRPEHIYLDGVPVIIDCLEFNRALRLVDPVDELAYLALECERHGAAWVAPAIFTTYTAGTGDAPPPALIGFYRCFRASSRARLAAWHMCDPGPGRTPRMWRDRADAYLVLAERHAAGLNTGTASASKQFHDGAAVVEAPDRLSKQRDDADCR
jgi:aminoglycoside phosphotransferase family enzyme